MRVFLPFQLALSLILCAVFANAQTFPVDIPPRPDYIPEPPPCLQSQGEIRSSPGGPAWHESEEGRALVRSIRRDKFPPALSKLPSPPFHLNPVRSPRSEPTHDQLRRLERRVEEAKEQGGSLVAGHYLISWKKEAFPYSLKREGEAWAERVHSSGKTLNQLSRELVSSVGGELTYTYNIAAVGFAAFLTPDQVETLRHHPDVATVEPDLIFEIAGGEQSIIDPGLWGLDRIDEHNISSENVYRYPRTGAGVHAYVIESGIRLTHSEFDNPYRIGTSYGTPGYTSHGTRVASVLGGNEFGVAKEVIINPVYRPASASGTSSLIGWIITAHEFISAPAVVNMSFGYSPTDQNFDDPVLFKNAIESLIDTGFVVVASAGNHKKNLSQYPQYPASYDIVITVGGLDREDVVWDNLYWKNEEYEEHWGFGSNTGTKIDIWAPAHRIRVATDSGDSSSTTDFGTSFAAPHVAGVAALYLEANPTDGHAEVKSYLLNTATMGKITGNLNGAPNRLLFHNSWFYPFHTYEEWVNSDPETSCSTADCWFERSELGGWVWTDADSYNNGGWFFRLVDQTWIALVSTTPCIVFWNNSTQQYETCLDP